MRRLVVTTLVVSFAFLLAACGGSPRGIPPTATSAINPNIPTAEPGNFNVNPFGEEVDPGISATENPGLESTLQALGAPVRVTREGGDPTQLPFAGVAQGVDIPPAGVVVTSVPGEPDAEAPIQQGPYDLVEVFRAGGPTNRETRVRFLPDGTVTIDGEFARNIGPQGMQRVNTLLDEADVFNISGIFAATIRNPDDYVYNLRVERLGYSVTHQADDALIPPELARLINELLLIAEGSPTAPISGASAAASPPPP